VGGRMERKNNERDILIEGAIVDKRKTWCHGNSQNYIRMAADQDIELSATSPAPCLSTCHHAFCRDNGLDLLNL
ncbi:hypothetical protein STEG23_014495, partial [Scotinomys teguina]